MNNYVISEIDSAQKKMGAYIALLNYRYMNLCVKAELGALMPVNVYIGDGVYNIEDVANINNPTEFQFGVFPMNENNYQCIIQGIYEAHPEFKMEIKTTDGSEDADKRFILYTMPEVDKNRHDLLEEGIKTLHEECCTRIEALYAEFMARITENLSKANLPKEDTDEAIKALDGTRNDSMGSADQMLINKQDEIDQAYKRYQEEQQRKAEEDQEIDFSKGFRLFPKES